MAGLVLVVRFLMVNEEVVVIERGVVNLKGCIVEEPETGEDGVKYVLKVEEFGKVFVDYKKYPVYEFGDQVEVRGVMKGLGEIDVGYRRYLIGRGIDVTMRGSSFLRIGGCDVSLVNAFLFKVKAKLTVVIGRVFPEPEGSFLAGVLFGARQGISKEWKDKFAALGITHILAVSGYNVAIIVAFVGGIFGFLGRRRRVILTIVFIVLFVIFVGAGAASVRAGVMGVIALLAVWYGRQYEASRALIASAYLMLFWNPLAIYDVGFLLSVLATGGLIFISPKLEKYFKFLPEFFQIRQSLLMTLSAQIACLPVIIWAFGRVSLISPLANVLILPLLPAIMLFGFLAVMVGIFSVTAGKIFGIFAYLLMKIIFLICDLLA